MFYLIEKHDDGTERIEKTSVSLYSLVKRTFIDIEGWKPHAEFNQLGTHFTEDAGTYYFEEIDGHLQRINEKIRYKYIIRQRKIDDISFLTVDRHRVKNYIEYIKDHDTPQMNFQRVHPRFIQGYRSEPIQGGFGTSDFQTGTSHRHGKRVKLISEQRKNFGHDAYRLDHPEYNMKPSRNHKLPMSWDLDGGNEHCRGERDWKRTKVRKQWMKGFKNNCKKQVTVERERDLDEYIQNHHILNFPYINMVYIWLGGDDNDEFEAQYAGEINHEINHSEYYTENEVDLEKAHNVRKCTKCGKEYIPYQFTVKSSHDDFYTHSLSHEYCSLACEYEASRYYDINGEWDEYEDFHPPVDYVILQDQINALRRYDTFKNRNLYLDLGIDMMSGNKGALHLVMASVGTGKSMLDIFKSQNTPPPIKSSKLHYCETCGEIFDSSEMHIDDKMCVDCRTEEMVDAMKFEYASEHMYETCDRCGKEESTLNGSKLHWWKYAMEICPTCLGELEHEAFCKVMDDDWERSHKRMWDNEKYDDFDLRYEYCD